MASRVPARPLLDEEPAITPQLGFIAIMVLTMVLLVLHICIRLIDNTNNEYLFQPQQLIYSPMRHGGKARMPEKSSPETSVWTSMTSSPCFSQTPNFSTTFRWYLCFTFWESFSQLEFCHEIPISKWTPSDRRNERRQTLFNAPGSTATNPKTSSER